MKKNLNRSIHLSRETLRKLDRNQLGAAAAAAESTACNSTPTVCNQDSGCNLCVTGPTRIPTVDGCGTNAPSCNYAPNCYSGGYSACC